jgi:hypothetical protein
MALDICAQEDCYSPVIVKANMALRTVAKSHQTINLI